MKGSGGEVVRVEDGLLGPDGPANARHCVGQGAGGLVVTDTRLVRVGPLVERW